ncbi:molybdopterin cofactor-binding domain-containing protein [Roseinatronobacter sp. NSM]|uniref:molybdopterin cofactor-binding domain-containing protein n=1 Tax=Roseinatronobacter sp. NSM TaxID=3457785 RepID=UPI004035C3C9
MHILHPATLSDALAALREPGARAVAGGSAFQVDWSQGKARPDMLVTLGALGLDTVHMTEGDCLRIGATVTLDALEHSALVAAHLPLLARALRDVAAPPVRRLATLGGQVGWGNGCLLPALLALGARVGHATQAGQFDIPLAQWLAAPAGLVLWLDVPVQARNARWCWRKVGLRAAFTPSIIAVAGVIRPTYGTRLAAGGGAVRPQVLTASATALDKGADMPTLRTLLENEIDAPDCAFRSGAYRKHVGAGALVAGLGLSQGPQATTAQSPLPKSVPPAGLRPLARDPASPDWHMRPDMPAKVAGDAGYLTDLRAPDMLVGRILRAGRPHARILSIDTHAAQAMAGVYAVVTHADIAGLNGFGIMRQDQPALCADIVRYQGDAVAAVAAVDADTADAALAAIIVDYADLPAVTDPAEALDPASPALHEGGNLVAEFRLDRGDPAAAFAAAAHVVEETYVTPRQMHAFMETEGGWCAPTPDGGVVVAVGGQHGARDREQLARILALPETKIRVITSPTGGGFGGKDELTVQPALALLAIKAGRAVRLQLSRAESTLAGVKRNPMRIAMRTACDAAGHLLAQEVRLLADCGAYASLSPAVVETAMEHAAGPYRIAHVTSHGQLVYTNNGTGGAFRGFGANQMTFAIECQIDRLAAACGLDPAQMRRRNLRVPGSPGYLGHVVAGSERLHEMVQAAAASALWHPVSATAHDIRATGMALNYQGNGLGSLPHDSAEGRLSLAEDGMIEVACGLDEMGQGLLPALQAAVATHLGCARSDVRAIVGDTAHSPDSGSTSASRGGFVAWQIGARTAPALAQKLLDAAASILGTPADKLRIVAGGVAHIAQNSATPPVLDFTQLAAHLGRDRLPVETTAFDFPKTHYTRGNARFVHCFGATLARVSIDRIAGMVRVTDLEMHTAAGPVIDLSAYLGQIEGGVVQGLGMTLSEDTLISGGHMITRNLDSYILPGIRDVPAQFHVTALEGLDADDTLGPRGVGELGIGAVTAAIANAVGAALGRWPATTPFAPETILNMLEGRT